MKRSALLCITLAAVSLLLGACSDQNASDSQAHPAGWVLAHGSDVGATGGADNCKVCHGATLGGGTVGVACLDCHVDGPPFRIHPSAWRDAFSDHRSFAESLSWTTCATVSCHGMDLDGGHGSGETGPSCFSDGFTNRGGRANDCHGTDGPTAPESHEVKSFSAATEHGSLAKGRRDAQNPEQLEPESGQVYCRNCHGAPLNDFSGGFVAAPEILDQGAACSVCHAEAKAHPAKWTRSDATLSHSTTPEPAWSVGCALCHLTDGPGEGPFPAAPSCFSANFTNVDGVLVTCHDGGPGSAPHPLDSTWYFPGAGETAHYASALPCVDCHSPLDAFCAECHFGPSGSQTPDAGLWTHGIQDHAAGSPLDFRNEPDTEGVCLRCHGLANTFTSAPAVTTCDNCHGFTEHAADYFAAHPAAAQADLLACRQCHDTPAALPNYDGYVSGVACTQCHPEALAHPFDDTISPPSPRWTGHSDAGNLPSACSICHNTDIPSSGPSPLPAAPACAECHPFGFEAHTFPFVDEHATAARADLTFCQRCHSDNPAGGPGSEPRFNVPFPQFSLAIPNDGCESCHLPYTAHPAPWLDHLAAGNIAVVCGICHGASLEGGTQAPACADCHDNAHSVPYVEHGATAVADPAVCGFCHGQDLAGEYGPACSDCHTLDPFANTGCTSCHNDPPDGAPPVNDQYANRAGKHAEHLAISTPGIGCTTCHPDLGTAQGAAQHYTDAAAGQAPATVVLDATYQAASGTLGFQGNGLTGGTCSGVSCHGGQQAPNWLTGSITVSAECTACHESGTSQSNSYSSGNHGTHAPASGYAATRGFDPTCSACHDADALEPDHFAALDTPEFVDGAPEASLRIDLDYDATDPAAPTCTIGAGGALDTAGCHTGTRTWGGVPHIVGQQWLLPTEHAAGYIDAPSTCLVAGCHTMAAGGGGAGPACRDCHTASDPVGDTAVCTSCHAEPPNGSSRPNRRGEHLRGDHRLSIADPCSLCHNGAESGSGGLQHFDRVGDQGVTPDYPAEVQLGVSGTYDPGSVSCNVSCHGTESWY